MTTTPRPAHAAPALRDFGPLDEDGRLVHDGDAAAQLALALARAEHALAGLGLAATDVAHLTARTPAPDRLTEVLDVLTERLADLGAHPEVHLQPVAELPVPGMLVALDLELASRAYPLTPPTPPTGGPTPSQEEAPMSIDPTDPTATTALTAPPGTAAYDAARVPWNLAVDQQPAAVAVPHTVEEVAEVVRAAAAAGLRVAPQSTGHNAGPLAAAGLDDVVLLRLSELTGVTVDPVARTARVLGGTLWGDVAAAAAAHGLAAMHGSSPDVAVAGYVLGGGLSFYGRRHGLAAHQLRAIEVVLADGTLVRADAEHHADLFWALRGGGGNLGVVVAMELALLPYADVHAGMLLWDRERAPEVVPAWADWTRDLPESVTTTMRVMSFPPLPELPPFLSGRQLVVIDGALLEDDTRAAELLAPLRALAPEMDTFERIPAPALTMIHMDPPGPSPAVSGHAMLETFDADAAAALLGEVGPGCSTSLLFAEVRHLGGALQRPAEDGGALSHLADEYALFCVAIAPVPEAAVAGLADADRVVAAMRPWSSGRRFLNFTERPVAAGTAYDAAALARLRRVRDEVDPAGLFVANHPC